MANIFRQALEILDAKSGGELTEDEQEIVNVAIMPLMILPKYSDMTLIEGLEDLFRRDEEATQAKKGKE